MRSCTRSMPTRAEDVSPGMGGGVPGSGYDLGLEGPVRPWAPGLTAILDLEWADPTTFYFIGQINNAGWSLYRVTLGSEPVLVASGLGQTAGLDVRR